MWLYYFLVIFILICAVFTTGNDQKKNKIYIVLTMGVFAILAMFKSPNVGNDSQAYIQLFDIVAKSKDISTYTWRYEKGFLYLNLLLSYLTHNSQILFIITGLFVYIVFGRFIYKHSNIPWLSVFLFFTLRYFDMSLSGTRQILSLATVALSYEFILNKKLLKFVLTVFLATLFHNVAIIFFLAYFLTNLKLTKKLVLSVFTATIFIYISIPFLLQQFIEIFPRYSYYLNSSYMDGNIRMGTVASLGVFALILTVSEFYNIRIIKNSDSIEGHSIITAKTYEDNIQSIFLLMGCSFLFFSLQATILIRFANIFGFFAILYYPNTLSKIQDKKLKILTIYATVILFFTYATIIQIYRPEWQSTYPYTFFWFQ